MALLDEILNRTGAIGAKIRGYTLRRTRDEILTKRPPIATRTRLVTSEGKIIHFDVADDIQHDFPSKVTSFPVEDKSTISDHVVNENPTFSISGLFSDAALSMTYKQALGAYTQADVKEMLLKVRDDRKFVSIVTPIDTFTDLILKGVSFPKNNGGNRALVVNLEFEKIRRVSSETTTVFVSKKNNVDAQTGDDKTKGATEKEGGRKNPQEIKEPSSSLRGLIEGATQL